MRLTNDKIDCLGSNPGSIRPEPNLGRSVNLSETQSPCLSDWILVRIEVIYLKLLEESLACGEC